MSCGVGHRHSSEPVLLWLWRRPAAAALIRPLPWEPPFAAGTAPEKAKRQKKKRLTFRNCNILIDDCNWIRKMWYIYTIEYYSAIKKNNIMPFAATWMKLETLILSEVVRKRRTNTMISAYIWNLI